MSDNTCVECLQSSDCVGFDDWYALDPSHSPSPLIQSNQIRCNGIITCENNNICERTGIAFCLRPDLCIPGITPACHDCTMDIDCEDPLTPLCRIEERKCKECLNDTHCTSPQPYCDTSVSFSCGQCVVSSHCAGYDDWFVHSCKFSLMSD